MTTLRQDTAILGKDDMDKAAAPPSTRWALGCLALSMLLSSLGVSIANIALPTLAQAFDATFQDVQWVVLAYLLVITTMAVSVGRLGDILGHRRVLLSGLLLFTVGSVLCGMAPALWMLILARAVQGLGAAVVLALAIALVGETVPKARTGSAMGLLGTMSAIGTALGPSLGGFLIAGPGWRAIFLIMAPLGVANFLLAWRHLPARRSVAELKRPGFDGVGTVWLGLTLAAYALAMTVGRGQFTLLNLALLAGAAVGLVIFLRVESVAASPLIRLAALLNAALSGSLGMNALVSTVMMATLVVGPFYLSTALGLSAALVGLVMSVGPLISTMSGIPAGRLVDRFGVSSMTIGGLTAMALGSVALAVIPAAWGITGYVAAIALITPGYQLFQAANNTAVMRDVAANERGVISGMLSLSRNLGLVTGASLMGGIFAIASGTGDPASAAAVAFGMQMTFAVAAGLIVLALTIALGSRAMSRRSS